MRSIIIKLLKLERTEQIQKNISTRESQVLKFGQELSHRVGYPIITESLISYRKSL